MSWFSKVKDTGKMMKCSRAGSPEVNTFAESRKNQRDQWDKVWHCSSPAFQPEAKPAPWQRLNNKRWKNKITCIYTEQDPKAHKHSFTRPLNARKGKENVQWKHNEKLGMATLILMKNTTNKQIYKDYKKKDNMRAKSSKCLRICCVHNYRVQ